MSEIINGKIHGLLERANRQNDSSVPADSSVTNATRVFSFDAEAEKQLSRFHKKLLHIENWNTCSGISSFELFDKNGNARAEKTIALGDFIKVSMPGSGKDDWVKTTEIYETADEIVLTVQPSQNPTDAENEKTTSHFLTDDSTNNFCLQRKGAIINFYVIGLNEKTNTEETSGVLETVRNYATANLGHFFGIQKAQWKTFCRNFLEIEK